MRKVLLGAVVCAAFGLSANGAGAATASVNHPTKRLACHWVTVGDHTLKLLRYTVEPISKTAGAPADRPVRLAAKSSTRGTAVRVTPVVARAEPVRFDRQPVQRVSLMVGVGY
jgi:hypothetical protein